MKDTDNQLISVSTRSTSAPTSYLDTEKLNCFLKLIRDTYPKADLANLFLEQNCKEPTVSVAGLANLRDVLSHFSTYLREGITAEKRDEQLINATEHLRRGTLEPYELTYRDNLRAFQGLFKRYVEELLPTREDYAFLASAPTRQNVEARLDALHKLTEKGRLAKANNDWIPEWEAGIACYIDAFRQLRELSREVEEYWYKFEQVTRDSSLKKELVDARKALAHVSKGHRHGIWLHYAGMALAVALYILGEREFHITSRIIAMWQWLNSMHLRLH